MRVLQIGADRSKRGILVPGSKAYGRQMAYAEKFGQLDIIGFSLQGDGFTRKHDGPLHIHPTNSVTKFLYGLNALFLASNLPWPDVISAQDPFEAGMTALLISRFVRSPLHVQVHTDFLDPEYGKHSLMNRARVLMAGVVLRRAARVRVVSQRIKESVQKTYALTVPITVLPIFTDIERMRSAAADDAAVHRFSAFSAKMLYVGRLESEKNPALALWAFATAVPQSACLIFIGTGSESAYLQKRAHELGVADRVFFEGERDVAPYFALADLVLVTSHYEGYGLVIVEALAAGKPVLATDVGIAREAGAIIANGDYASALAQWFKDGPRQGRLSSYAYSNFDEYVASYCADIEACTSAR